MTDKTHVATPGGLSRRRLIKTAGAFSTALAAQYAAIAAAGLALVAAARAAGLA